MDVLNEETCIEGTNNPSHRVGLNSNYVLATLACTNNKKKQWPATATATATLTYTYIVAQIKRNQPWRVPRKQTSGDQSAQPFRHLDDCPGKQTWWKTLTALGFDSEGMKKMKTSIRTCIYTVTGDDRTINTESPPRFPVKRLGIYGLPFQPPSSGVESCIHPSIGTYIFSTGA